MSDLMARLDQLTSVYKDALNERDARIKELEAQIERLASEALVLAEAATRKGELRPLPENEDFFKVIV